MELFGILKILFTPYYFEEMHVVVAHLEKRPQFLQIGRRTEIVAQRFVGCVEYI